MITLWVISGKKPVGLSRNRASSVQMAAITNATPTPRRLGVRANRSYEPREKASVAIDPHKDPYMLLKLILCHVSHKKRAAVGYMGLGDLVPSLNL